MEFDISAFCSFYFSLCSATVLWYLSLFPLAVVLPSSFIEADLVPGVQPSRHCWREEIYSHQSFLLQASFMKNTFHFKSFQRVVLWYFTLFLSCWLGGRWLSLSEHCILLYMTHTYWRWLAGNYSRHKGNKHAVTGQVDTQQMNRSE